MPLVTIASGRSIAFGARQVVPAGLRGIWRDRTLGINILVAFASVVAVALGNSSEVVTVLLLLMLAEAIEYFTLSHTARSVEAVPATIQKLPTCSIWTA